MKKLNLKPLMNQLVKHRVSILALVVLALLGFTLLRTQGLSVPAANEAYLEAEREKAAAQEIQIDPALIEKIKQLSQPSVDVAPRDLGTADPFNP